jgi:hypothetical protein
LKAEQKREKDKCTNLGPLCVQHVADGSTGTNPSDNMAADSRLYIHAFRVPEFCKHMGFNYKYPDIIFVHFEDNYVKCLLRKSITS